MRGASRGNTVWGRRTGESQPWGTILGYHSVLTASRIRWKLDIVERVGVVEFSITGLTRLSSEGNSEGNSVVGNSVVSFRIGQPFPLSRLSPGPYPNLHHSPATGTGHLRWPPGSRWFQIRP
jgi:hypothetical protein